jgi:SAM-dependent methyltransferase
VTCPHCQAADRLFDDKVARRELRRYLRKGPRKPTRLLLDAVAPYDVEGRTLLDIGGGIGIVQHELAARGVARVTDVDASQAYLETAREEARRRGYVERAAYLHGDFVELANRVEDADLVTLDKVVCCYPDAALLLDRVAARTKRRLGLVWPRDRWWTRAASGTMNLFFRIARNPFRMRIHPDRVVESTLAKNGLQRRAHLKAGFWQVAVYERPG